jgi:hypothetical protein
MRIEKITYEELYNLYSSSDIISMTKSKSMRWDVHARDEKNRIFVGKLEWEETTWKIYVQMAE